MEEMQYYVFQIATTTGKIFILLVNKSTVNSRDEAFSTIMKYITANATNNIIASMSCMSDNAVMV